jgi:N-acetylglucosaminyldiphosphoundecaprenol N-acetyl-beta-D-mannosaminyltransferase
LLVVSKKNKVDSSLEHRLILGMRVDATSYTDATRRIIAWARARESRYVCISNVHMVMESYDAEKFRDLVNKADLVTPDGMPLVWALKRMGVTRATRVYGPDLTLHVCEAAARESVKIGLYGGTAESLRGFVEFLENRFAGIQIVCSVAPPFRPLSADEDEAYTRQLKDSGAQIVLVGIGCPKQEFWMAEHKERLRAVLLGVGAAFDFHSGKVRQSPRLLQRMGLEWAFRLMMEPKRLWRRYARNNPRFVGLLLLQLATAKRHQAFFDEA